MCMVCLDYLKDFCICSFILLLKVTLDSYLGPPRNFDTVPPVIKIDVTCIISSYVADIAQLRSTALISSVQDRIFCNIVVSVFAHQVTQHCTRCA